MKEFPVDADLIRLINENLGIAHKVCRIYFPDHDNRNDAFQEMMYQIWRSYPAFDGRSKFSTWMYSVCLKTALTYRRRSRRMKTEPLSEDHHQIPYVRSWEAEEAVSLLYEAIARLSPLNKAIILLYLDDLSYEEIAGVTGLTKSNVSVRLVRIKRELEVKLRNNIKSIKNDNT